MNFSDEIIFLLNKKAWFWNLIFSKHSDQCKMFSWDWSTSRIILVQIMSVNIDRFSTFFLMKNSLKLFWWRLVRNDFSEELVSWVMSYILAVIQLCTHSMIHIVVINWWVLDKFLDHEDFSKISILQWFQFCFIW